MASMISGAETGFEPIPGYVLRDKIGVGGYGEVWLADAPGGLKKAIKFVFGSVDEERAGNELKSLQRIRAVNHPFILSLERIEIVDSHLMVVTELADGSLLDRFREFHERGLVGIPRDRLIEYMRDTADALDFLCQRHDLQHLDVKPANLLLVADRIKVADFGLIKDVQRNSMSLMGGMTPTYAAPEMFDGRPGRYSDQYSLAIVYQEMLTGVLPFRGRTTAQLATEHLHKAPNLEELPVEERLVIARALSKKPSQRFGSCREMIDALVTAHAQVTSKQASARQISGRGDLVQRQQSTRPSVSDKSTPIKSYADANSVAEGKPTKSWDESLVESASTERREVVALPTLDLSNETSGVLSPVFFIGFGGTGAEILTSLRSRLQSSDIDLKEQRDLGWLLIDTDEKTVQRATDAGTSGRLHYEHILLTPLKSSQQYRDRPQEPFAPLSRRWLYNVPRSQTTEGVRPLAMLAYLDHAQLCRSVVEQFLENLAAQDVSSTELDHSNPPIRIYLLGSVHGATGSVLSIELAFLIQQLLQDLQVNAHIQLVLTAANESPMIAYELATAAGIACVHELNHYSQSAGLYPGIPTLPPFHQSKAPWDHVYLVHGGKLGDNSQWYSAIEQTIDFLCMDACTALGSILDKHRGSTLVDADNLEHHEWTEWLRTFGSEKIDLASNLTPEPFVKYLSLQSLQPWLEKLATIDRNINQPAPKQTNAQIDFFVNDLFRENRWTAQSWVRHFTETLMSSTTDLETNVARSVFDFEESLDLNSADLDHVVNQLGLSIEASQNQAKGMLISSSKKIFDAITNRWLKSNDHWLSLAELLEEVRQRFKKQDLSLQTVAQRFRDTKESLLQGTYEQDNLSRNGTNISNASDIQNQIRSIEFQAAAHTFAGQLLVRLSEHVHALARVWSAQAKGLLDQFKLWSHTLANDLDICVDANGLVRDDRTPAPGSFGGTRQSVQRELDKHLLGFVELRFLQAIQNHSATTASNVSEDRLESPETVDRFIDNDSLNGWIAQSVALLTNPSTDIGMNADGTDHVGIHGDENVNGPLDCSLNSIGGVQTDALSDLLANHELPFLCDGGAKRSILMIPKGTLDIEALTHWQSTQNFNFTIVEMEGLKSAQLYTEGEQIQIVPLLHRLWLPSHERCQLAERLHSRNDIEWLPMR